MAPQINIAELEQERNEHKLELRAKDSEIKKKAKEVKNLNMQVNNLSIEIKTLQGDLNHRLEQIRELEQARDISKKQLEDALSAVHTFEATVDKQKVELQEALISIDAGKKREADQRATIDLLQDQLTNIQNAAVRDGE